MKRQGEKRVIGRESQGERDLEAILQPKVKTDIRFNRDNMIRKELMDIGEKYQYGEKIGEGSFGEVFKVIHKELKVVRALKVIKKNEDKKNDRIYDELEILKKLDHPNVLKVFEYFQNENQWLLITQFLEGKELFDEIVENKSLSEHKAAEIFAQICKSIAYIHAHSIVHRDIKPQNILVRFQSDDNYTVKLIDWGLGSLISSDLVKKCGTPEYCAPEVIRGNYGYQCDLWSLGVLLYVMLSGKFPFKGSTVTQTLTQVTKGRVVFKSQIWDKISKQAKNLITLLLVKDQTKRPRAAEILNHPWIIKNTADKQNFNEQQLFQTLKKLKEVTIDNKFHAVVINFIQNYVNKIQQEKRLKRQFEYLDENKDGVLSYEELLKGYSKIYGKIEAEQIVEKIFTKIDMDGSNKIEYSQFVTFASNITTEFSREQLREAFRLFDQDNNGKINKNEINDLLIYEKGSQSQQFDAIIEEIDLDGDGSIDIEEFIQTINNAVKKVKSHSISIKNSTNTMQKQHSKEEPLCQTKTMEKQQSIKNEENSGKKQQ